jgi:hypothetical protein
MTTTAGDDKKAGKTPQTTIPTITQESLKDLSVSVGKPLTEEQFRAWCTATGNMPTIVRHPRPNK